MFDLVKAIHADDLAKAKETLDLMRATAHEDLADLIIRARLTVHPLPKPEPLSKAIPLPAPGVDANAHFGGIAKYRKSRAA
ncbi:hypothetical protein [Novosphingobium sp. KN65.2]|uniref:hypothetical protein n=1 Tax=Novosphingobium sp. KN65.2 TaxID=1478134 RepID=UPI0012E32DD3|nr:hypothetical protein [Novosphingobium sp. KN65.2]